MTRSSSTGPAPCLFPLPLLYRHSDPWTHRHFTTENNRRASYLLDAFLERLFGQDASPFRRSQGHPGVIHWIAPGRLERGRDMATESYADEQGYACSDPCTSVAQTGVRPSLAAKSSIFFPRISGLALHPIAAAKWPVELKTVCLLALLAAVDRDTMKTNRL